MKSGEWRVASGEWRVARGEWRVASGEWRVASGEFVAAVYDRRSTAFSATHSPGDGIPATGYTNVF